MSQAGYAALLGVMDEGTVTGARESLELEPTADYRLRVGVDQVLFSEQFPGTALNSSIWVNPSQTIVSAVAGGWVTLNSGLSTAANLGTALQSKAHFNVLGAAGLSMRWRAQLSQSAQVGNVIEMGLFYPVQGSYVLNPGVAPLDGCFFRIAADQTFKCVSNVGGVEVSSGVLNLATLVGTGVHDFAIDIMANDVHFWIDDVLVADLADASGAAACMSASLPAMFRYYNTAITAVAQTLKIGSVQVLLADVAAGMSAGELAAIAGRSSSQGPTGGTVGLTALWPNAAAPTAAAAPTNTTAALGSGLGGIFQEVFTLAAGTDGIISSYQVPLGTAAIPGKTLMITAVTVDSVIAVTSLIAVIARQWCLAYGHTGVTLATTESLAIATPTKAPRKVPLGIQGLGASPAVGLQLPRVGRTFEAPIAVYPGEFVQVCVKNQVAGSLLAAASHVIAVEGYWV
jgi:hypothetical protein